MVQKYIIDKADIHNLLTGKEIPLGQGSKARAFCLEITGGMTNGEVVKSVFSTAEIIETTYKGWHVVEVWFGGFLVRFRREWWNAPYNTPYKAESIDPNDMTHMFDGVTEFPKDAFKGWDTEELLKQIRAEREEKSNGKNE